MALRRKMRRWSYLAQPSIFFLMTYSDRAEPMVKNFKTTSDGVLPLLVTHIASATPAQILSACRVLDSAVEQAKLSGDLGDVDATQLKVRQELLPLLPNQQHTKSDGTPYIPYGVQYTEYNSTPYVAHSV
ncbi:hypothetical protein HD806DRAFT_487852 [Xylariaceae sp. AK1471]|nr:hypothetical protein HD806DRAFT_487852 [Xylariaceae sp. AK1471]